MPHEKAYHIGVKWDRWQVLCWRVEIGTDCKHHSRRDSQPSVAALMHTYRPKANCDIVITPKHAAIIRFSPVMA